MSDTNNVATFTDTKTGEKWLVNFQDYHGPMFLWPGTTFLRSTRGDDTHPQATHRYMVLKRPDVWIEEDVVIDVRVTVKRMD